MLLNSSLRDFINSSKSLSIELDFLVSIGLKEVLFSCLLELETDGLISSTSSNLENWFSNKGAELSSINV